VGGLVVCSVDASGAGIGNLEITVSSDTDKPTNLVDADDASSQYHVTFTPLTAETYSIAVKFNGDPVPGDLFIASYVISHISTAESNRNVQHKREAV